MSSRLEQLTQNYSQIKTELGKTQLLIVSKNQPIEEIKIFYQLGHRDFGENRVQDLLARAEALKDDCPEICWHMIGHVQTNKIKQLLKTPNLVAIHSIDRMELLDKILNEKPQKRLRLFLQINTSQEDEKSGFENKDDIKMAITKIKISPQFELAGFMTMATLRTDDQLREAERCFRELRALKTELYPTGQLSMGMSDDYLVAIKNGTDWVRIGSKLFKA